MTGMSGPQRIRKVLEGLKPVMETVSVKRAGSMYQVPHPVSPKRATMLAIR